MRIKYNYNIQRIHLYVKIKRIQSYLIKKSGSGGQQIGTREALFLFSINRLKILNIIQEFLFIENSEKPYIFFIILTHSHGCATYKITPSSHH